MQLWGVRAASVKASLGDFPCPRAFPGMPVSKLPGSKGDLILRFDVAFPRALTEDKKRALRSLLAGL